MYNFISCLIGDTWKQIIADIARAYSRATRVTIANVVYNKLASVFGPDITWVVIVYGDEEEDPDVHYTKGNDYYSLYNYFGNDIVVFRMIYPRVMDSPYELGQKFKYAYSPHYYFWFPFGNVINAKSTALDTWYTLIRKFEIRPWNMFTIESDRTEVQFKVGGANYRNTVYIAFLPSRDGLCIIMAESTKQS